MVTYTKHSKLRLWSNEEVVSLKQHLVVEEMLVVHHDV